MLNDSILSTITFVPTVGAIVVALLPRRGKLIQWFTLLVSLLTFLLTLHLPAYYQYGLTGFQFEENHPWITSPNIHYHLGIDGISLWLVVLVAFLGPLAGQTRAVRLVHGEPDQAEALARMLQELGFADVAIPARGESIQQS